MDVMKRMLIALLMTLCVFAALAGSAGAQDQGLSGRQNVVSAGSGSSCVIMADGSLLLWGSGDPGKGGPFSPVKLMDHVRSISLSTSSVNAITADDTLWQIETGYNGAMASSPSVKKMADHVLSFQSDYFNSYLTTFHELKRMNNSEGDYTSISVTADVVSAALVTHGFYGSGYAVVRSDGSLWMSGIGFYGDGKEPNEDNVSSTRFTKVMDDVLTVNSYESSFAVIKKDHSLWTWGGNSHGQLGNGTTETSLVPVKILDDVVAVDCGTGGTWGALRSDGSLWMWGDNGSYTVGTGPEDHSAPHSGYWVRATPTKVLDHVASFSCGRLHTLAVKTDGSLWAWGKAEIWSGLDLAVPGDAGNGIFQTYPVKILDGVMIPGEYKAPEKEIAVKIDGKAVQWTDVKPFINADNRTMVPLRAVAEAMGLEVTWDPDAREAIFSDGDGAIYFPVGINRYHHVRGGAFSGGGTMDTTAVIVNGRTFAPIRYLADFFGYNVDWDGDTYTVIIQSQN